MIGLRQHLIRIVLLSGLLIAVVVVIAASVFYFAQNQWSFDQITLQMQDKASSQINDLVASFLIPEQSAGRDLLLQKYISDEKLESAKVLLQKDTLSARFSGCQKTTAISYCRTSDGAVAAVVVPISESDVVFGHLLKSKFVNSSDAGWIFHYTSAAFVALTLVVLTIIIMLSRAYGRITFSLKALEEWTGKVVLGANQEESPQVHFKEFKLLGSKIKRLIDEGNDLKKKAVASEIARQVAHDIRAPVTALSILAEDFNTDEMSPANRSAVMNAAQRINEIADRLINQNCPNQVPANLPTPIYLGSVIENIIAEKRIQYKARPLVDIQADIKGKHNLVAIVDSVEIKRVLSNLINNAVESIENCGQVQISLSSDVTNIKIKIVDDGRGIPSHILEKLGQHGLTYGRKNGSGLGVYHAAKTIRSFGGVVEFDSVENKGTCVTIILPKLESLTPDLPNFQPTAQIIVIDDDPLIHKSWDLKFVGNLDSQIDVIHFYSCDDLKRWFNASTSSGKRLFLVDYELSKNGPTGLDLIEELGINEQSILVSGRANDSEIQVRALRMGVRTLMKNLVADAPIFDLSVGLNCGSANGSI